MTRRARIYKQGNVWIWTDGTHTAVCFSWEEARRGLARRLQLRECMRRPVA